MYTHTYTETWLNEHFWIALFIVDLLFTSSFQAECTRARRLSEIYIRNLCPITAIMYNINLYVDWKLFRKILLTYITETWQFADQAFTELRSKLQRLGRVSLIKYKGIRLLTSYGIWIKKTDRRLATVYTNKKNRRESELRECIFWSTYYKK